MAWLWEFMGGFVDNVQPVSAKNRGLFRKPGTAQASRIECELYKAFWKNLSAALTSFVELGLRGRDNERPTCDVSF